ncbi:MAG: TrmH family RNA methyltransferase [Bacteroidetes bacterium]|nr:TrmH family RNA methyltransferase [Bacteroidota bacterium]
MAIRKLQHLEIERLSPGDLPDAKRHPISLLLHDIRSAHNVGSALRSADGARIADVLVSGYTPTPENKSVYKTSLGAEQFVPWRQVSNPYETISALKNKGYTVAALELTDSPSKVELLKPQDFPLCLIAGNEVDGVDDQLLSLCDLAFEIPQYGAKQSLNVSVAIGIVLFDLVRQFRSF